MTRKENQAAEDSIPGAEDAAVQAEESAPRAEEIIAEVYRQLREKRNDGRRPEKVVMMRSYWRAVEDYRSTLGPIDGPVPDYLSEEGLFGLEIWYGNDPAIRVE